MYAAARKIASARSLPYRPAARGSDRHVKRLAQCLGGAAFHSHVTHARRVASMRYNAQFPACSRAFTLKPASAPFEMTAHVRAPFHRSATRHVPGSRRDANAAASARKKGPLAKERPKSREGTPKTGRAGNIRLERPVHRVCAYSLALARAVAGYLVLHLWMCGRNATFEPALRVRSACREGVTENAPSTKPRAIPIQPCFDLGSRLRQLLLQLVPSLVINDPRGHSVAQGSTRLYRRDDQFARLRWSGRR